MPTDECLVREFVVDMVFRDYNERGDNSWLFFLVCYQRDNFTWGELRIYEHLLLVLAHRLGRR